MIKLLVAAMLVATPIVANAETISRTVHVADLDLRSPAGVGELDRRIARAARQVCELNGVRAMWELRRAETCRAEAVAGVVNDREAALGVAQGTRLAVR